MAIQTSDKVVLDLTDDTELRDYFSRKGAGESCEMEIKGTLDEASSEQAVLSITGVVVDEYESKKESAPAKKKDVAFKMRSPAPEEEEGEY
tara:strand:+ start:3882 stop:4154 length:273 start_codon:yes stop_codon:yes gene_type:complete